MIKEIETSMDCVDKAATEYAADCLETTGGIDEKQTVAFVHITNARQQLKCALVAMQGDALDNFLQEARKENEEPAS